MQHLYEIDVRIPMRDGVGLDANVWRPAEGTGPALLAASRTARMGLRPANLPDMLHCCGPATRWSCRTAAAPTARKATSVRPYGRPAPTARTPSRGSPASRGRTAHVGMYGLSYMGTVQWETAATSTPGPEGDRAVRSTCLDNYETPWYLRMVERCPLSLGHVVECPDVHGDAQRSLATVRDGSPAAGARSAVLIPGPLNEVLPTAGCRSWQVRKWSDWLAHPTLRRVLGRHGSSSRADEGHHPGVEHRWLVRPLHRATMRLRRPREGQVD